MSRPVFHAPLTGAETTVSLSGEEAHHAADVRRLRIGAALRLTDGAGRMADATVAEVGRGRLVAAVTASWLAPPATPRVCVALGIVKGERMMRAVEALTEAGADEILAWTAERTVAPRAAQDRVEQRLQAAVRAAAKQSGRAYFPGVSGSDLTGVLERAHRAHTLVCDLGGVALAGTTLPAAGEVLIVVGPEGGLSEAELGRLTAAGAGVVGLGPNVLRAGTAALAALTLVNAGTGRWRLSSAP